MIDVRLSKVLHGAEGEMTLEIDAEVKAGEFIALMGESGSGKTTLLRILAGLEESEGSITVGGINWESLGVQKREIGFVHQDYALFTHMTVEENLLYVKDDKALAQELLELTQLSKLRHRNVQTLSGGQKQRVSLCRAMMKKPKILLLDEPLSALDKEMKEKLIKEIHSLHQRFETTTIMVSHDKADVVSLATRVWVLSQGKMIKNESIETYIDTENIKAKVLQVTGTKAQVLIGNTFLSIEVDRSVKIGDEIDLAMA